MIARTGIHYAAAIFAVACALIEPGRATPPTPPATIELDDRQINELAARSVGEIVIPVQVRASRQASALSLKATLRLIDPERPYFQQPEARIILSERLKADPFNREGMLVRAPLFDLRPGEYVLDIVLSGRIPGGGFSDRQVRRILVDQNRRIRILKTEEHALLKSGERRAAFEQNLQKNPKSPRVRMLMEPAAQVPARLSDATVPQVQRESERLLVRPSPPSGPLKDYSVERGATSWTSQDPVTVRGRLTYLDADGNWKPLVNVTVDIWDEDWDFDEHLGMVGTDWDGRWSFSANNDDGWFQDGRDIYYSFRLENTRLHMKNCDDDYVWSSAVHDDVDEGSVIDFGTETAGSDGDSLIIWSDLNIAWNHAVTSGGQDPGLVNICFPASKTSTSRDATPTVNVATNRVGGDSPTHEYGHAIMSLAYGGDPSPGGGHGFDVCDLDNSLAWSEGWATGFMLSVRPDGAYNWTFGDGGFGIENFSMSCRMGELNEGWVAAALLDMLDGADDNNGGTEDRGRNDYDDNNSVAPTGLASMLRDTMWGSAAHLDVRDFWYALAGEVSPGQKSGDARIMFYDWMTVFPPLSCVATKVATSRLENPSEVLAGLRRFRNLVLKPAPDGRELINAYYRNSPEMALLLLQNPAQIQDALAVIEHFAAMGDMVSRNTVYREAMLENREIMTPEVRASVERLNRLFAGRGGATLRRDVKTFTKTYDAAKSLRLAELQEAVIRAKATQQERPFIRLAPFEFSPESRKALEDSRILAVRSEGFPTGAKKDPLHKDGPVEKKERKN